MKNENIISLLGLISLVVFSLGVIMVMMQLIVSPLGEQWFGIFYEYGTSIFYMGLVSLGGFLFFVDKSTRETKKKEQEEEYAALGYRILSEKTEKELEKKVNFAKEKGWYTEGGVAMSIATYSFIGIAYKIDRIFIQAIVKDKQ